jgi:2-hydroxychromene-2-carboxylate isomerase
MLLGVSVMKTIGLKPLLETPLKRDYVLHDTARYIRRHGLKLARQLTEPMMDPRASARGFYWVRRNRPGQEADFAREALSRYWVEGADLSTAPAVAALAPAVGATVSEMLEGIESDLTRADLRDAVAASLARGVFGSPFFVVDGEPFWGSDRLELLDEWLTAGGW